MHSGRYHERKRSQNKQVALSLSEFSERRASMSTLHLVEIDADENIIEEIEVDDDILQALQDDGGTELSLSDDDNELYLVELDDDGDIVDAVAIGQDDYDEDTELSLEDRVDGLELSIASMLGKGAIGAGRAIAGKARSGFAAVKNKIGKFRASFIKARPMGGPQAKRLTGPVDSKFGSTDLIRNTGMIKPKRVGLSGKGKLAVGLAAGATGAYLGNAMGANSNAKSNARKRKELSLSADQLLDADYNPLLADVESRTAK